MCGDGVEHFIAGEKDEGVALCLEEIFFYSLRGGVGEVGLVGVGQSLFDIESDLIFVIEWRAEFDGVEILQADSGGEEVEAGFNVGAVAAESGGGHYDGLKFIEEVFFDIGADVEGCAFEADGGFDF